ncbi:hypothetical protein [Streptomyces sp. NPDC050534]|uniref:hypothetical protein n=1 Tax=Streptomyces sp. NPDC050534 TaxID=3365625 RepID=UPI00379D3DF5
MNADDQTGPSQWAATSLEHFDQLARGVLRAARDAARELKRTPADEDRKAWALGVLAGQTQAMLGDGQPVQPPAEAAAQKAFVCTSLKLAVHALAHRWSEADLALAGQADVAHLEERQMADAFDALGRLVLPHASPEGWTATICTELARGDKEWEAVVKLGKYILHPTLLGLADDLTRTVGQAVHNINVHELQQLGDSVRDFTVAAEPAHHATEPAPAIEEPTSEGDQEPTALELQQGDRPIAANRARTRRRVVNQNTAASEPAHAPPPEEPSSKERKPPGTTPPPVLGPGFRP